MVKMAKLALEDGTVLKGDGFGYETTKVGELVFSTGMVGYTESLTDPSFKGEILMSTYPLEGNYGVSEEWYQSDKIQAEGFVVREVCREVSNFSSQKTLGSNMYNPSISHLVILNFDIFQSPYYK